MRFLTFDFFVKHLPLGHCLAPLSVFANNFDFTEIFEFKVDSAGVNDTAESKYFA
jgi:hypothetical protein